MSHTRVAVVQFDYHPAALIRRRSPLEDPIFELGNERDSLLPTSGVVPDALLEPFDQLRARIRREHARQVMLKLAAVFERCRAWGVQMIVLPEYSVAPELLAELAGLAEGMLVVAGTHAVERARLREGIYAQLGWREQPRAGTAVAPVLHRGRLLALQSKLSAAKPERDSLVLGDSWASVEWELGSGPALPGPLAVMICLDFLYREREIQRVGVGPALDRSRFLAVPSYTPWHSRDEFAARAWEEARRYGRPVLWANVASQGGSSIFVDEGRVSDLRDYPSRVGLLEAGDEGVVVADVDLGFVRSGPSTRFGEERVVKPFAVASLVYRHHPVSDRYAAWLGGLELGLAGGSVDEVADAVVANRTGLIEAAALAGGQARARRIRRLLAEIDRVTQIEELSQFTREVVLPEDALPLEWLRQAWADGAAELVFGWMREHRGAGLEEVEERLRKAGKGLAGIESELWTERGLAGLRASRAAVIGAGEEEANEELVAVSEVVREVVPATISLRDHTIREGGFTIEFRATFEALDFEIQTIASGPQGMRYERLRPPWLTKQSPMVKRLGLLRRGQGSIDVTATRVGAEWTDGALFICEPKGKRRQLTGFRSPWLEISAKAIEAAASSCHVDVRMIDLADYYAEVEPLISRFTAMQAKAERFLAFRLAELGGASAPVRVKVDDAEQSQAALEALDEWAESSDRAALVIGPFGTGKSTLLAQWAAQRWQRGATPLPILVDLATASVSDPLTMLLAAADRDPASEADRAALALLIEEGRVIPCFDAFDEMATRINFANLSERLAELLGVAGATGKVLVASRDHYFTNLEAARAASGSALKSAGMASMRWLHLQPFGFEQVEHVVHEFIPDAAKREQVLAKIRSTYDLEDLVQTPMLLAMVLQTIDELDPGARVGTATVYERYLERFLDHSETGEPDMFTRAQKRGFAEVLAAELWRTGEASIGWQALHRSVMARMLAVLPTDTPPEAAFLEIQGGSFLVWEGGDRFRFAHKSFLEFFMAKALLAGLERDPERTLDTRRITPEVAGFIAQLLRARGTGREDAAILAVQRWLSGGRSSRSGEVNGATGAAANALRVLRDVARELGEPQGWLPRGADLRGIVFDDEELRGLDLQGARLDAASLSGVDFEAVDLRGASLVGARMSTARLREAKLDEVDFDEADLTQVEAQGCSLRGARFGGTKLRQSSWSGCAWAGVRMREVEVGPTWMEALDPELCVLQAPMDAVACFAWGHSNSVTSVAWSPDGSLLASSSHDTTIRVWHTRGGSLLSTLRGHQASVTCVAWSPDGTCLASSSEDTTIRVWHVYEGSLRAVLQGHDRSVTSVAWSPDSTRLATASDDKTVRIWRADSGALCSELIGHRSNVTSVAWSPDGTRLASSSFDRTVRVWLADSGTIISTLVGHEDGVTCVAWSPDSTRLVSSSNDRTVRLWLAADGSQIAMFGDHAHHVTCVAWSPDGTCIASSSSDKTIRLWHVRDCILLAALGGHNNSLASLAWSPDGTRLAYSSHHEGSIGILLVGSDTLASTLVGHESYVSCVVWSPDGTRVAASSWDKTVRVWRTDEGALLLSLIGHEGWLTSVAWSPDGTRLASSSFDKTVRLWHAHDGAHIVTLLGHERSVACVAWSPDGTRLASSSDDGVIRIWEGRDGTHIATLLGHKGPIRCVAWSPDGTRLASAGGRTIRLWLADEGISMAKLVGHENVVMSVAWSPDNARIASSSLDNTIRLWDSDTGTLLLTLCGHTRSVPCVAWSPNGTRLASSSGDQTVRLWDADTGSLLSTLEGHSKAVTAVAWSPDGERLASSSYDNTVRLWKAAPEFHSLEQHTDWVLSVAWSPDGTQLASAGRDKSLCLWNAKRRKLDKRYDGARAGVHVLAWSLDGQYLASGTDEGQLDVWTLAPDTHRELRGHTKEIGGLAWSPAGELASASADRTICIWDPASGRTLASWRAHENRVNCVTWSPDGQRLASGSSDHDIRLWNREGTLLRQLDGHSHYVTGVAWSPDAARLVSSSWDHTLRLWDIETGEVLEVLEGHRGYVKGVAWSPDGRLIASCSADRSVRLWRATDGSPFAVFDLPECVTSVGWSPDGKQLSASTHDHQVWIWQPDTTLAILSSFGESALAWVPSGHFHLQPANAPAKIGVRNRDRNATFYLPLAGMRERQSAANVARAIQGLPVEPLPWPSWDGEVRRLDYPLDQAAANHRPRTRSAAPETIRNPFSPNTALDGRTRPHGRDVAIDDLTQALLRHGSVVLRGPRRAGKTSLLAYLEHHTGQHPTISVNLQAAKIPTTDDLAKLLAPDLAESSDAPKALRARLAAAETWPLIMLDEVAKLIGSEDFTFDWLRALGQEHASIVYSGSHYDWVQVMRRVKRIPGSSFGNDLKMIDLGPMPERDAIAFLVETAPEQAPIPARVAEWVQERCGGWPFYLQVLGYALVQEQLVHQRPLTARSGRGDLEAIYRRALLRGESHYFKLRWQEFTNPAKVVLLRALEIMLASKSSHLPSTDTLAHRDASVLVDNGALGLDREGWMIDRPFLDWMTENFDFIRNPEED